MGRKPVAWTAVDRDDGPIRIGMQCINGIVAQRAGIAPVVPQPMKQSRDGIENIQSAAVRTHPDARCLILQQRCDAAAGETSRHLRIRQITVEHLRCAIEP